MKNYKKPSRLTGSNRQRKAVGRVSTRHVGLKPNLPDVHDNLQEARDLEQSMGLDLIGSVLIKMV